jgi:hypothetical protein
MPISFERMFDHAITNHRLMVDHNIFSVKYYIADMKIGGYASRVLVVTLLLMSTVATDNLDVDTATISEIEVRLKFEYLSS